MFLAPIIQTLVNKAWFRSKKDDGVRQPEFFKDEMLSLAAIALVLTVVCSLACYGEIVRLNFLLDRE
jgi:hypothetical protein